MNKTVGKRYGVKKHETHKSGRRKTVCTTAVLAFLGVEPSSFHYSDRRRDVERLLRANGFSVRSRMSSVPKRARTVGALRTWLASQSEDGLFYVSVPGHAMLLDRHGNTVVDTDPRQRDRRRVVAISLVRPK